MDQARRTGALDEVRRGLSGGGWLQPGDRVLAAVSGGADSVALLQLLVACAPYGGYRVRAAHFEHGIRGEASREDACFVRTLCERLGVPLVEGAADVPVLAQAAHMGLEQAAREARYGFLRAQAAPEGELIALGHHLDDQAETVLMHLLRGSGLGGLGGMRRRERGLFRPLLGVRKREIVAYLAAQGILWREDATNGQDDTPRNALRLGVMPQVERVYPGAVAAIGRLADIAALEDGYLEAQAQDWLSGRVECGSYGWRLRVEPPGPEALTRRALMELMRRAGSSQVACADVEQLLALLQRPRGACMLPGGLRAERCGMHLYLVNGHPVAMAPLPLPLPGTLRLPDGRLSAEPWEGAVERHDPWTQVLDREALEGAVVRFRRRGDVITPLGAPGRQSLSDYLINRRVDRPLRDSLALVAAGNQVLWAVGVGIAEQAAARPGQPMVRLRFAREPLRNTKDT